MMGILRQIDLAACLSSVFSDAIKLCFTYFTLLVTQLSAIGVSLENF